MSISGSLEDVSVADVMQFIHLGRRTGTLVLTRDDQQARIGFHHGKLVSAHTPGVQRLGTLLVDQGLLDQTTLDDAVAVQKREENPRSLGQILVGNGDVDGEELRQAIVGQIETAVSRAVSWERGSFEFVVDNLQPVDDIAIYPGDLVPDSDINTQMVLLEAARIFDERNRDRLATGEDAERDDDDTLPVGTRREATPTVSFAAPPQRAEEQLLEPHAVDAAFEDAGMGPLAAPFQRLWLDVVSQDADFVHDLVAALPDEVPHVQRVDLEEAGATAPGHMAPVVLVDLRDGRITPEALRALHRARPRVASVALVDEGGSFSEAYAAGAKAALPASPEGVTACIENLLQLYRARVENEAPPTPRRGRDGVARLRRVFGDLRSGLISATVALNLMHIISESVERAVLFLVKRDDLTALGAFGLGVGGQPLAEATRGLRIGLDEDNALTWTLEEGEARAMAFEEAGLPERFAKLLGRPKTGQVVIFPVLGAQRVISIIYTDNGDRDEAIEDIEILELATAQVGMAFENELLRRQISEP